MAPITKRNNNMWVVFMFWLSRFRNHVMTLYSIRTATFPARMTIPFKNCFLKFHPFVNRAGDNGTLLFSHSLIPCWLTNTTLAHLCFTGIRMCFPLKGIVCSHNSLSGVFKRLLIAKTVFAASVSVFFRLAGKCFRPLRHFFFTPKTGGVNVFIHNRNVRINI